MAQEKVDICLVNMPVSPIQRPSLALGILSAHLKKQGFRVKVIPANMWFAEYFGLEIHSKITKLRPQDLLGEWLFTGAAFPDHPVNDEAFFDAIRGHSSRFSLIVPDWEDFKDKVLRTKAGVPRYMEWVASEVRALEPVIVGCTSMFQQHVASLGLLRGLKDANPGIVTMMGGPNCETVMGKVAHENFSWVDYIVSGEADEFIAGLCRQILDHGTAIAPDDLPEGVFAPAHRETGYPFSSKSYDGLPRAMTASLHDQPPPDYDDFFEELKGNYFSNMIIPGVPFEGSRGCWWGQKSHCTFCGLNGTGMDFRDKTTDQLEAEINYLYERYGVKNFEAVDNIISLTHLKNFLPRMEENKKGYSLFFETKANLKRGQVAQFRRANVRWIQPGIESLSSDALSLMKKGVKAWQNIQTLKYSRKYGIHVSWTMLCGFPGEKDEWYEEMARLPAFLSHLQPGGLTYLRYDRYSVYHRNVDEFGIDLTPTYGYEHIYPVNEETLNDLAYFFYDRAKPHAEMELVSGSMKDRPGLMLALEAWQNWRQAWRDKAILSGKMDGNEMIVTDTRPIAFERQIVLDSLQAKILTFCDGAPTMAAVMENFSAQSRPLVEETIEMLKTRHFIIDIDERLVSLVLDEPVEDILDMEFSPFGRLLSTPMRQDRVQVA